MSEARDETVHAPAHYTQGEIECIEAIRSALGGEGFLAYCRANAIKYLWRCTRKGHRTEDLKKAAWYVERAVFASTILEGERDKES